ncbi:response regulator [Candidatus Nitrospira bockiana]
MSRRILIVDDDASMLQALAVMVQMRLPELVPETSASAREALDRMTATRFEAVVSDIKMPGMDGLELTKQLRRTHPTTPIVLITGHGDEDLCLEALGAGAFAFVQKPIDRNYFLAAVGRAIEFGRLSRDVQRLREHEERMRLAQSAAHAGLWDWDVKADRAVWSDETWDLFGLPRHSQPVTLEFWQSRLHPDDRGMAVSVIQRTLAHGERYADEFRIIKPDGQVCWHAARGRVMRDADGAPIRLIGLTTDITARKRVEEELRMRLADTHELLKSLPPPLPA